jgi:hypothetical protein
MPRSRRVDVDNTENETEEEETTPRRRRRVADDDDEEAPRPRRRKRDEDEDEETEPRPRKRSRRDEDDDDDSDGADALVIPTHRGRESINKHRPKGEGGDLFFRWEDEAQIVKFLPEEPWAYDQHWVKRSGKQSFPCIGEENGCPLCEIGVKIAQKIVYVLVNLSHDKGARVQVLEVGPTLDDMLYDFDQDSKTGPLDRLYWALSRNEKRGGGRAKYNYVITPVKERDLEEDWEIDPADADAALDEAETPSREDVLGKWSRKDLQAIADEAMGR